MREMFFGELEPFDTMVDALRRLEKRINELTRELNAVEKTANADQSRL